MNEIEKLCKIKVPLFSKLIEKILLKIEVQGKIVFKDENFLKIWNLLHAALNSNYEA